MLSLGFRVGSRLPLDQGAAGIAILAGRPETDHDSPDVIAARRDGFSVTRSVLRQGAVGVVSPIRSPGQPFNTDASLGVVALEDLDVAAAARAVTACARRLADMLGF
jgi:DNA-binding IclR family transcriptional regulator